MIKRKMELNYRQGYTHASCEDCNHYVADFDANATFAGRLEPRLEPRCKEIGLHPGQGYRVGPRKICDRYDNSAALRRIRGY